MTFESYYSRVGAVLHCGLAAVLACKDSCDILLFFWRGSLRLLVGLPAVLRAPWVLLLARKRFFC